MKLEGHQWFSNKSTEIKIHVTKKEVNRQPMPQDLNLVFCKKIRNTVTKLTIYLPNLHTFESVNRHKNKFKLYKLSSMYF